MSYEVNFRLEGDLLYYEGECEVKNCDLRYPYKIKGAIYLGEVDAVSFNSGQIKLHSRGNVLNPGMFDGYLNFINASDDQRMYECLKEYQTIKAKKEMAKILIQANPFFKKEELLEQVDLLCEALNQIKA